MKIAFIEGPTGRVIPAQRVRTVYSREGDKLFKCTPQGEVYVSHFETCPGAREFSRR